MNQIIVTIFIAYALFLWFLPKYKEALQSEKIRIQQKTIDLLNKELEEKTLSLEKLQNSKDKLITLFFAAKLEE